MFLRLAGSRTACVVGAVAALVAAAPAVHAGSPAPCTVYAEAVDLTGIACSVEVPGAAGAAVGAGTYSCSGSLLAACVGAQAFGSAGALGAVAGAGVGTQPRIVVLCLVTSPCTEIRP